MHGLIFALKSSFNEGGGGIVHMRKLKLREVEHAQGHEADPCRPGVLRPRF